MEDIFTFTLSLKGNLIGNSIDAMELTSTIIATTQSLKRIARLKYNHEIAENLRININSFRQGSFQSEFILFMGQSGLPALAPLLPHAKEIYITGKELLTSLKLFIDIKSALKGNPPEKVTPQGDGNIQINISGDNNFVVVTPDQFKILQDKQISSSVAKIVDPLSKENSEISELDILVDEKKLLSIDQENAVFLRSTDTFQQLPNVKYKGIVSKIDKKACSGYIYIGNNKLSFSFKRKLSKDEFGLLVDSLKNEIQIYLVGTVTMDFEANPKHMDVIKVEADQTLF